MHHYTECGLNNVYLCNGYEIEHDDGEEYVSVEAIDDLHRRIANLLIEKPFALTGQEIRFLRIEMSTSQKNLGLLLGMDAQTVARWEKGQTELPRTADAAIRSLYAEYANGDSGMNHFLHLLAESEATTPLKTLKFQAVNHRWQAAA